MPDSSHPPCGPVRPADDAVALERLGALTHSIYRSAHSEGIQRFDELLFAALNAVLEFDAAWIGHSTLTPAGPVMHSSVLHQLTPDYVPCWEAVQTHDPLVHSAIGQPGLPATLTVDDAHLHPEFRAFLQRFGIGQVLCTTRVDPTLKTCVHLSLYRRAVQPLFGPSDQALLAATLPNLAAAIALNRMRALERIRSDHTAQRTGVAMASRKGVIQYADPGFGDFMLDEWPDWQGGLLPAPLRAVPDQGQTSHFSGSHLLAKCESNGDLLIVTLRRKSRIDALTPRESAVALQFARGNSYKAVARDLGMAPSTVRHHLRQVYTKLQIQDKGAIAWALSQEAL